MKGRSASFEELAEEQKQQRKSKKLEKLWADAGLQQMSSSRSVGRASPSRYHSARAHTRGSSEPTFGCWNVCMACVLVEVFSEF